MKNIQAMEILIIVFIFFLILFLHHWMKNKNKKSADLINWPIVGMLPGLVRSLKKSPHELGTKILIASGGTFVFKGPWFCNMDFVFTCDPINIHHIFSKSFSNYWKGPEFRAIFEPLGDGILAVNSDCWAFQRKMVHSFFRDERFETFLEESVGGKVVEGLYEVLDHACVRGMEVDVEDVIQRLGFDIICVLILGYDPKSLSVEFPEVDYDRAISQMEETLLYRHVVPEIYWKLMKWLQLGTERKCSTALKTYDRFIYSCIQSKLILLQDKQNHDHNQTTFDFLTAYLTKQLGKQTYSNSSDLIKFLRDASTSLLVAGRDTSSTTLSWLFHLLAKNPSSQSKIFLEIEQKIDSKTSILRAQDVNKLVYLHAALCETLRLYPSLPLQHKASVRPDTLPSGHRVGANTKIFVSYYAMGRMEGVWGGDCLEFKPERWISEKGTIVHVPSYKFSAFGAGPRRCLGKDMSLVQMKIIAVAILLRYRFEIVEDGLVEYKNSVILRMKHGMRVRVSKRGQI